MKALASIARFFQRLFKKKVKTTKPKVISERLQWFYDHVDQIVWPSARECECHACVNGYINGIKIQSEWNAEGLDKVEHEKRVEGNPIIYFDSWQERNQWLVENKDRTMQNVVNEINDLNEYLVAGRLPKRYVPNPNVIPEYKVKGVPFVREEKKLLPNDDCFCGSGLKLKKCCG